MEHPKSFFILENSYGISSLQNSSYEIPKRTTVCDFEQAYEQLNFDVCLRMLQSLEFCADYCEYCSFDYINHIEVSRNLAIQRILTFDKDMHRIHPLRLYNQKATNFFGFGFVYFDAHKFEPAYNSLFFGCVWRVPHPNPRPDIDSPHINGNSYMTNPKEGRPLHIYLNEWAKAVKNNALFGI